MEAPRHEGNSLGPARRVLYLLEFSRFVLRIGVIAETPGLFCAGGVRPAR